MFNTTVSTVGDVIEMLLKASMSNPLIGIIAAFASGAVLHKAKILTDQEWTNLKIVLFASAGITLSVDVITAIEKIVIPTSGFSSTQVPTQPSANILVFSDNKDQAQLNALLQQLALKK